MGVQGLGFRGLGFKGLEALSVHGSVSYNLTLPFWVFAKGNCLHTFTAVLAKGTAQT